MKWHQKKILNAETKYTDINHIYVESYGYKPTISFNYESYYTYESYESCENIIYTTNELINDKIKEMREYNYSKYVEYDNNNESIISNFLSSITTDKSLGTVESNEISGNFRMNDEFVNHLRSINYNYNHNNLSRYPFITDVRIDLEVETNIDTDENKEYIVTNSTTYYLDLSR